MTTRRAGRPTDYTPETAEYICEQLASGRGMLDITSDPGMPHASTVYRWLEARPDFATAYVRARERQADVMDERILEIADRCTAETAAADRVRLLAYQWRAARLMPKLYGDRVKTEHSGPDGGALQVTWIDPTAKG